MADLQDKGADQNRTGVLSQRADLQGKTLWMERQLLNSAEDLLVMADVLRESRPFTAQRLRAISRDLDDARRALA